MVKSTGPGKPFVIGITGKIGSGKSLALNMLRHLGALGLDADHFAHLTYRKGSYGYQALRKAFGERIISNNGEIDRKKLGKLVFDNPSHLKILENITHPLVVDEVSKMIQSSTLPIIAIEAIKLLQSDLQNLCNQIWIVHTPAPSLNERLIGQRGMNESQIKDRLHQQSFLDEKMDSADTVLQNDQDAQKLWQEVKFHWERLAEDDPTFSSLVDKIEKTMMPYANLLCFPTMHNAEKISIPIIRQGASFFKSNTWEIRYSVKIHKKINLGASAFHFLCETLTWKIIGDDRNIHYLATVIRHPGLIVIGYSSLNFLDELALENIFTMLQNFSRLHLCERLIMPLEANAGLLEKTGYDMMRVKPGNKILDIKPEYNLYEIDLMSDLRNLEQG